MPSVKIGAIDIEFPYEPYDCQKKYMESVIASLVQRQHAILESPTGTGKTLCLLCASLGWLEYSLAQQQLKQLEQPWDGRNDSAPPSCSSKFDAPLIIFSSRTHAQLNQAIQAFKNTAYSRFSRPALFATRSHQFGNQLSKSLPVSTSCVHPNLRILPQL
uniref:Helicase ATP-binding domain-containing protein n=1 Tax=Mesocestoides corti TaxID=53468 RepID=A0A5K3FUA1_MESCO